MADETVSRCIIVSIVFEEHFLDNWDKLHFDFLNSKTNWILYTIICTVFPFECFNAFFTLISLSCRPNAVIFFNRN